MTFDELIGYWGSVGAVSRALGASDSSVSDWRETGVPDGRQYQAELATRGRLRADKPALRAKVPRVRHERVAAVQAFE